MHELFTNRQVSLAKKLYEKEQIKFPFIHSVLTAIQNGRVFANSNVDPTCCFVMHDFGWSQYFGSFDKNFFSQVENFIFDEEAFFATK